MKMRVITLAAVVFLCAQTTRADVTFLSAWGEYGTGEGQFDRPIGLGMGLSGEVYVSDAFNNRVQVFTRYGSFLDIWGGAGYSFSHPWGIGVSSNGSVYVANHFANTVQKFTNSGTFETQFDGSFNRPVGVGVGPDGYVYVADYSSGRVQKFTSSGSLVDIWSEGRPVGVAVNKNNDVYVVDIGGNSVHKYTNTGTLLQAWGGSGSEDGQFNNAYAIAVNGFGDVYVVDERNQRVQKFTSSGAFITKWGTQGSGPGEFNDPSGVAVSATGEVYVVDYKNNNVQRFFDSDAWASGTNVFTNAAVGPGQLLGASQILTSGKNLVVTNRLEVRPGGTLGVSDGSITLGPGTTYYVWFDSSGNNNPVVGTGSADILTLEGSGTLAFVLPNGVELPDYVSLFDGFETINGNMASWDIIMYKGGNPTGPPLTGSLNQAEGCINFVVPEPASITLLAFGCWQLLRRRRKIL